MAEPSRTYNYKGYEMRSIAEARWAAFFDICEIKWQYEPMSTGDYIPDFLLFGPDPVLVEVKGGATTLGQLEEQTAYVSERLLGHWDGEIVLVGAKPNLGIECDQTVAGIILEGPDDWDGTREYGWSPSEAAFGYCNQHLEHHYGFASIYQSYRVRPHGCYDGNCCTTDDSDIDSKWAEATNRVRYLHGGSR